MDLIYKIYSMIDDKTKNIYIKQHNKKYKSLYAPIVYMEYIEQYTDPRNNYYTKTVLHIDVSIKELEKEQVHYKYWRALPEGAYKSLSFIDVIELYNKYSTFTKFNALIIPPPIFVFKDKNKAIITFLNLLQLIIANWDDWN